MNKRNWILPYVRAARRRYRKLDIFDQVREHKSWKYWCESNDIDMFLLTCTDEHFQDLLDAQIKEANKVPSECTYQGKAPVGYSSNKGL